MARLVPIDDEPPRLVPIDAERKAPRLVPIGPPPVEAQSDTPSLADALVGGAKSAVTRWKNVPRGMRMGLREQALQPSMDRLEQLTDAPVMTPELRAEATRIATEQGLPDPYANGVILPPANAFGVRDVQQPIRRQQLLERIAPQQLKDEAAFKRVEEQAQAQTVDVPRDSGKWFVQQGANALVGSVAPALAVGMATRSPTAGLGMMGGMVAPQSYGSAREEGKTVREAQLKAAVDAGTETLSEVIPLGFVLKRGMPFVKRVLAASLGEGASEGAGATVQALFDRGVLDDDTPWPEVVRQVAEQMVIGAGVGGTVGAALHPVMREPKTQDAPAQSTVPPQSPTVPQSPAVAQSEGADRAAAELERLLGQYEQPQEPVAPVQQAEPAQPVEPVQAPQPEPVQQAEPVQPLPTSAETATPVTQAERNDTGIEMVDPSTVQADAERFQFKRGTDEEGVSAQLKGTRRWDDMASGVAVVWEDTQGQRFIVDGHQRLALAKRLQQEGQTPRLRAVVLREADGITPANARFQGALKNLQEGGESTSALDVARVIREGGELSQVEDVIPPNRTAYRDGLQLAKLGDDAFGAVLNELIPAPFAAEVGRRIEGDAEQSGAIQAMIRAAPENIVQARQMVDQIARAGFERSQGDQGGLFGDADVADTLLKERAQVLDAALRRLRGAKRVFKAAVTGEQDLSGAGNVLNTEANQKGATDNARLAETIARSANTFGSVSTALTDAAKRVRAGASIADATGGFLGAVSGGPTQGGTARQTDDSDAGRGAQRDDGPGGSGPDLPAVNEAERGYEREASSVPDRERAAREPRPAADAGPGEQFDLFTAPEQDRKQAYADLYGTVVKARPVGSLRAATDTIKSPADAAHLFASIRKSAQESLYVAVTDANGKVLRVIRHTKGLQASSAVSPLTIVAEAASIPDAAGMVLAHNHPSGKTEPSAADRSITKQVEHMLDGTGIELITHVVLGENTWSDLDDRDVDTPIPPRVRRVSVPVTERFLNRRDTIGEQITSPQLMESFAQRYDDVLVLMNHQNYVVGAVPMTQQEMRTLREGGQVNRVLSAIDKTNASAAVIKTSDRLSAANMIRFLKRASGEELRVLDWIDGDNKSAASRGDSIMESSGPFHSRGGEQTAAGVADIRAALDGQFGEKFVTTIIDQGWLEIVSTESALPAHARHEEGGERGAYDPQTGKAWLVADALTTESAPGVFLHEVGVHHGLRGLMKPGQWSVSVAEFKRLEADGDAAAVAARKRAKSAGTSMDEEAIAYLVEDQAQRPRGLVSRIKGAIEARLFEWGMREKLSADGFVSLARGAARKVGKKKRAANDGVRYSRDADWDARFPLAGSAVDGRVVGDHIPNQSSIDASIENAEILDGVRSVPLSMFDYEPGKPGQRTLNLAEQIAQSGEIAPLIVAVDDQGIYVIEGGHRLDALLHLGAKELPALVVIDRDAVRYSRDNDSEQRFSVVDAEVSRDAAASQRPASQWTAPIKRIKGPITEAEWEKFSAWSKQKLAKVKLADNAPAEFRHAMRRMRSETAKAGELVRNVAAATESLTAEERALLSSVIEQEAAGDIPTDAILRMAAVMQDALARQANEMVRLGALSTEARDRWAGKYLPRFYMKHLEKNPLDRMMRERFRTIQGGHLKSRGLFETVPKSELPVWQSQGWELRGSLQGEIDVANLRPQDKVVVWRDYTPSERQKMGEVRDAVYRFVRGYTEISRDIALARLFERVATNENMSSRDQLNPDWVQVPDGTIPGTGGVKRYGALAGRWVDPDILGHLKVLNRDTVWNGPLASAYMKGLSLWKEGKTSMNPVVHGNNVVSTVMMADFAGIKPWDVMAYSGALKDYRSKGRYYKEAVDAGLFGGEFYGNEVAALVPIKEMRDLETAATGWLQSTFRQAAKYSGASAYRRGMGAMYQAEDQFFKLLIFRHARQQGQSVDEAVDLAERYVFNYAEIPAGIRAIRNAPIGLPFISYSYKAIPALARVAATNPWVMAKWVALFGGVNWAAYQHLFGDDDREEKERALMPEYMEGMTWMSIPGTDIGVPKAMRLPIGEGTGYFLDLSRRMPMGDMFDAHNQMGGVPMLAPFMPNNPVVTTLFAMLANKDSFTGREVVEDGYGGWDNAKTRMGWLARQMSPNSPFVPFSYSFDKVMNGIANETGGPIDLGVKEYTGKDYYGREQSLPQSLADTLTGTKVRKVDFNREHSKKLNRLQWQIRDLKGDIRADARHGGLSDEIKKRRREKAIKRMIELSEKGAQYQRPGQ